MTEPKAWHCPSCNAYHGPHVDTCPKPAINLGGQHSYGQSLNNSPHVLRTAQQAAAQAQAILGDQRVGVSVGHSADYIQSVLRTNGAQSETVPL